MLTKDFFSDAVHADFYLRGSVIRLEAEPVYVHKAYGRDYILLDYTLCAEYDPYSNVPRTLDHKKVKLDDEALDFSPLPLGMVNLKDGNGEPRVVYASRMPYRVFKVGQSAKALSLRPVAENGWVCPTGYVLPADTMVATVKGQYPDYGEAFDAVDVPRKRILFKAFNRHWALGSGKKLFYKALGEPVGLAKPGGPELFDDYSYLDQALKEAIR